MSQIPSLPSSGDYACLAFSCFGGTHAVFKLYDAEHKKSREKATLYVFDKRQFRQPSLANDFLELARREFDFDMPSLVLCKQDSYENDQYLVFATKRVFSTLYGYFNNKNLISRVPDAVLADPAVFAYNFVSVLFSIAEMNAMTLSHFSISPANLVALQNYELSLTGAYFMSAEPDKIHLSNPVLRPDIITPRLPQADKNSDVAMLIISLVDCYFQSEKSPTQNHFQAIQQIMNYKLDEGKVFDNLSKKLTFLVDLDFEKQKCLSQVANFKELMLKAATEQLSAGELVARLTEEPVMKAYLQIRQLQPNTVAVQPVLFDIAAQMKYLSKPLFINILLPKIITHLADCANHAVIVNIVCSVAIRERMSAEKLYLVFEPIMIALTGEQHRTTPNTRYEPFAAYIGTSFETAYLRYENPYAKFATPKVKQLTNFVPTLTQQLNTNEQNDFIDAQIALLEVLGYFLGQTAPGACHLIAMQFLSGCLVSVNVQVVLKALKAAKENLQLFNSPFFMRDVQTKGKFERPVTGFLIPTLCTLIPNTDFHAVVELAFDCLVAVLDCITDSDVKEVLLPLLKTLLPAVRQNQFYCVFMGKLLRKLCQKMGWKWFAGSCLQLFGAVMEQWRDSELLEDFRSVYESIVVGCEEGCEKARPEAAGN